MEQGNNFDHLVYLRIFEGCNLHCKHCFIPSNPKRMTLEQIAIIPDLLSKKIPIGSKVLVQWHGGEPTLLGSKFMSSALSCLNRDSRFIWSHGIQTNLMNYNSHWCEIYKKYFNGEVGVSWDEKIRLLKSGNEFTKSKRFEEKFWPNVENLIKDGLNPYLIVTATKVLFESYENPIKWFDKITSLGIKKAHLERITKTGYARKNWDEVGIDNLEYSKYMSRWYKAYVIWNESNPDRLISLSPFDGLELEIKKLKIGEDNGGYGCWSGTCDTKFHTIDSNGYKFGCTAITSEFDNPSHKNNSVVWFGKTPNALKKERKGREAPCISCKFKPICKTGCLTLEKMDDSGECSGAFKMLNTIDSYS